MSENNAEKIKIPFKIKKDHFLIAVLVGLLLLVIAWPTSDTGNSAGKTKRQTETILSGVTADAEGDFVQLQTEAFSDMSEAGMLAYAEKLENTLEEILSSMDGAGKVKVMLTVKASGEMVLEKDVVKQRAGTTEVDSAGGSRNSTDISQEEVTVFTDAQSGGEKPYVKQVNAPVIQGILVAAEGGGNQTVVKNITEAIQALFGIEAHKIKIVKMNSQ